jgi:hypothetical protein
MGKRTVLAEKLDHIRLAFRNSCRVLTAYPPGILLKRMGRGLKAAATTSAQGLGFHTDSESTALPEGATTLLHQSPRLVWHAESQDSGTLASLQHQGLVLLSEIEAVEHIVCSLVPVG